MCNFINGNLTGKLSVGQGERGKSIEYMWRGTELGIRQEGEEEYHFVNLAGGSDNGVAGREIEFQVGNGYLQWRYKGEEEWKNLIAISELKGDKGEQGIQEKKYYLTPQEFGAKADGVTDDTAAIQQAIDEAKKSKLNYVFIPAGTYAITTIKIPEYFLLSGVGRGTVLKQLNTATSHIIDCYQGACYSRVTSMRLEGFYDTTKPVRHGISLPDYKNTYGRFDSSNTVDNVCISDVTGDGIYIGWGQRGIRIKNSDITRCGKAGIRIHGSDNVIMDCGISVCREEDIKYDWGSWNTRVIGCKTFHAGCNNSAVNIDPDVYMMRILGNCNHVFSDVQESVGGGLRLQGTGNKIDLMIDGCGKFSYDNGVKTTVIKIDENSLGNNIRATITDGTLLGYAKYLLDISKKAFNNYIDLTFHQYGDPDKRQGIELLKDAYYHFSNTITVNGITRVPIIYENIKFTSVNGFDGQSILWNEPQQKENEYSITINKSIDSINKNNWMYLCFNNKFDNDFVKKAKNHNNGILQLQFDFDTNVILSDKYVIDVITFAGATTATDVYQRVTTKGTVYMSIPCKILNEATEYNIAIGIRKMVDETNNQPETTTIKISNLKVSFGDFVEDKGIIKNEASVQIPTNGSEGQFLVSNGDGSATWITVKNGNEVAY